MGQGLDYFSAIQAAVSAMLITAQPEFLAWAQREIVLFAVGVFAVCGYKMVFQGGDVWSFVKVLVMVSMGYAMVVFYQDPIPGFGISFTHIITDTTTWFGSVLDRSAVQNSYNHYDDMLQKFVAPGTFAVFAGVMYLCILIIVTLAKAGSIVIVAFALIAQAVCLLLGPIFVPFFVIPKLDFLFWGWLKALCQYSFMPVVAYAYLMIFERFLNQVVTQMPNGITADLYLLYGLQVATVAVVFIVGLALIPALTSAMFSGHGGHSALDVARRWW